jgi:hypothetical protein
MPHKSIEESREVLTKILKAPETYAIVHKQDKSTIGSISLMQGKSSRLNKS